MSNVKITDLLAGVALTGAELFEMVQATNSRSTTAADIVTLSATWTADQEAAGFDIKDISNVEFRTTTGAPAGTVRAVYADAAGMNINALTATEVILRVAGTSEFSVSATQADFKTNNIIGVTDFTLLGNVNFPDGVRQTFNPDATAPGLNVGSQADPDPTTPINGDIYYNSTNDVFRFRQGGAWIEIGSGAIATINGDGTAAQIMAAGTGLDIVDAGATHTYSIDATVATLTGAQTLTNKTIAAASNTLTIASTDLTDTANLVRNNAATTYTAGVRQDFLGLLAGTAGLNVGAIAGSPTTQVDGDLWYDSNTNTMFGRVNGADVDLGQQSMEILTWTANHDANGFALEDPLFADPTDITKLFDLSLSAMTTAVTLTLATAQASSQTLTIPTIVAADSLVTNNVAATLLSKTLGTGTAFAASPSISDGITFTFNPDNTNSGINVGENATDPTSPNNGDIYYQTGVGFRIRDQAAWATLNQPDTPWTVAHDAARFPFQNIGTLEFSTAGPMANPAATVPHIIFDDALAPDAMVYNVPSANEHRIHVNGVEEYTFTASVFNGNANVIQNFTSLSLSAVTPGPIIQLTNSSSSPAAGTTIAEMRWIGDTVGGGNVDYAIDRTVVRDNTSASPDGERQLLCESAGTLVEYIAMNHNALGITFFGREISFSGGQGVVDSSFGREILVFQSSGTSAVNEIQITNAITATGPIIEATGGDTDIPLNIRAKGEGSIFFADDDGAEELLVLSQVAGIAANYIEITNALGSANPILAAAGATGNTGLEFRVKGEDFMLFTNDGNEEMLQLNQVVGAAVNYLEITNSITATDPIIEAVGTDANVGMNINPKGTGVITIGGDAAVSGDLVMGDRFQGMKGADVASATTITLVDGNFFDVTGTTQIDAMTSTNWQAGSVVILHFDDALTVTHNTGADGFFLQGAASFVTTADDTLTVVWNGSRWEEISRSVN